MISYSPSGALSPYFYKGGYFHGIHYGSYFDDMDGLRQMMEKEERFTLDSPEKHRIMIDLYETQLTKGMAKELTDHISRLKGRIIKLSVAGSKSTLRVLRKGLIRSGALGAGQLYFCADMEEGKTWLVN